MYAEKGKSESRGIKEIYEPSSSESESESSISSEYPKPNRSKLENKPS